MGIGGGCKGLDPGTSPYLTHSYCKTCSEWRIGRPLRCPECNMRCRLNVRYNNGSKVGNLL